MTIEASGQSFDLDFTSRTKPERFETVTVPMGRFDDVLRVFFELTMKGNIQGISINEKGSERQWYAAAARQRRPGRCELVERLRPRCRLAPA